MDKNAAIEAFGGVTNLAKALGVTRPAIHQWPDTITEPRASQVREAIRAKIVKLGELV